MVKVEKINKSFGPTQAVSGLSFQIDKGEIVGFLGPNGAGKTTAMRILACFLPADSGSAEVAGFDIVKDPLEIRRKIGYLPENAPLYPDMQVSEYLSFVAEIRDLPSAAARDRIGSLLEICRLTEVRKKIIGTLSKGFRQRVGLAQVLIHQPDLLILDEPTSGLDPKQIIEMRELIKNIGREKTVILCSHILSEVAATCNRILIIKNGSLTADSPTDALRSKGYVSVRIKADGRDILEELESVPQISGITPLSSEHEEYGKRFKIPAGEECCSVIYQLAVKNGWTLTELSHQKPSLEETFLELTGD
ncbi:MAG: ABC transporter ATP-binding protein [bacterium]